MAVTDDQTASLYAQHADELVRFATGLVGPSDASDVVSDALVRLLASAAWKRADNPRALMFRAVLRQAQMFHRSAARRRARETRSSGGEAYEMPDLQPEVATAVSRLSSQQRAVVFLTYWNDLDVRRIAELLGVSEGTVRKQLDRGRAKLREVLS